MKKLICILSLLLLLPVTASACTYENIKLENGKVTARWIPCNDPDCKDYQRHFEAIKNSHVVSEHNVAKDKKPTNRYGLADLEISKSNEVNEENEVKQVEQETEKQSKQDAEIQKSDKQENTGKVYDKKQHRERDVDAIKAERDIINSILGF